MPCAGKKMMLGGGLGTAKDHLGPNWDQHGGDILCVSNFEIIFERFKNNDGVGF